MRDPTARTHAAHPWLLACGIAGAALYPLADIFASTRYPGFSYRDQAVSELFAIGAPTSDLVVPLFTLSSTLLLLFAAGIWMSAGGRRVLQWASVMMALNAIDALVLWNFFPMHMRGEPTTFTDTMHGILAIDPFLLTAVVLGGVAFRGKFRAYTVATIAFSFVMAIVGFSFVSAVIANEPTPWMGAAERAAQYTTNLWYAVFAAVLLREWRSASQTRPRLTAETDVPAPFGRGVRSWPPGAIVSGSRAKEERPCRTTTPSPPAVRRTSRGEPSSKA